MALSDFEKDLLRREFTIPRPPEGTTYTASHCLLNTGDKLHKDMPVLDLSVCTIAEQNGQKQITRSQTTICCPDIPSEDCIFDTCKINENNSDDKNYARVTFLLPDTFFYLIQNVVVSIAVSSGDMFMSPNIPEKKLTNAIKAYAPDIDATRVLYLCDTTFFGGSDEGFLVTNSTFRYNDGNIKITISFDDLVGATLDDKQTLHINCGKETFIIPNTNSSINIKSLKAFFDTIKKLRELGKTSASDKIVILSDMPPPVRIAYVGLLAILAVQEGGMNDQALAFLQMLMVRLDFSSDMRREMNSLLSSISTSNPISLKAQIDQSLPSGQEFALGISLMKDAISFIHALKPKDDQGEPIQNAADNPNIISLAQLMGVDRKQLSFLEAVVIQDEKILRGDISDDQYVSQMKDLTARASAVGVPIAAVYLSGSVVGLSAAGITSGLATLGLGGVLGLSSMVTGIGTLILVGVGVYKGMNWIELPRVLWRRFLSELRG
ncbi:MULTISPECIES: Ku family protein [Acetobacter]|uniref:Uncharacterized protein n=1 Tax=Acetobacter ascendens TaxID=481146 RepID=A0A1Y0V6Q9_9PROT|nr:MULTISPECIES: hypothetical protein [Acetobacter]ARW12083.1 hypothetical protein S101447_03046 [Acetobacter ascendens]KAA8383755.1 hypothetical protein FKW31_14270 [Acetobacter sp. DmW_136]